MMGAGFGEAVGARLVGALLVIASVFGLAAFGAGYLIARFVQ